MKLGRRPSFKMTSLTLVWQVQCPSIQVQKQSQFLIKNEVGPKAQLQGSKSDAGVTSPASQHPSPETVFFLIKKQAGPKAQPQNDKSNAGVTSPMSQHSIPETIIISR